MSRFEAVLLDFANTVVQFDRPQIEAIHVALAAFLSGTVGPIDSLALGEVMDRVCVMQPLSEDKRELTPLEQMELVLREAYGRPFQRDEQAVVDANREYQERFVSSLEIDDLTRRALERVRRRVPVGLVSNYPCGPSLRRSLTTLGIAGQIDPVVISGEVGCCKPHPKLFETALEGLGVAADKVLFVGDDWASDMVGGHGAGMATCHHLGLASAQDYAERYAVYRPDYVIRHLDELDRILTIG
jgi:putative hydrolase of the HAD superfamily